MNLKRPTALAIVCSLVLIAPAVNAQEGIKKCAGVEVRSMDVSKETGIDWPLSTGAEIKMVQPSAAPEARERLSTIVFYGPILGSMDSPKLKTDWSCTPKGVTVTATITRSAAYSGSVLKNILWRPKITVSVVAVQAEVAFESIWKMRLTDGQQVGRAQTPPYPEQKYPITVPKTLRLASRGQ